MATDPASAAGLNAVQQAEPVDLAILEQLRVDLEDEDGSAVASLVDIYLADLPTLRVGLTAALQSGDTAAAAHLAHSLRSPTALVGAEPLATLLQRVEDRATDGGLGRPELAALAQDISREADRVVDALARLDVKDWSV